MSRKRILFIVNPISGHRDKRRFGESVAGSLGDREFAYEIVFTERAGHATDLASAAVGKYDIVAAAGGDGTLNEVARGLLHSDTAMAIIPCGSGNGLARCLHIPLNTHKALHILTTGRIESIDTGTVNGRLFLSVAGIGLDAQTAHDFAQDPRRGFVTYAHYATSNYFHLKPQTVIDRSRYLTEIQSAHITVERPSTGVVNIDGEPVIMDATLEVGIVPKSLRIVTPTL